MNRIIWIGLIALFFCSTVFSAEVQDLTPEATPEPVDPNLPPYYAVNTQLQEARILSAIARVETRLTNVENKIGNVPSAETLTKVKDEVHNDVIIQLKSHFTNIIILLLVAQAFFMAVFFMAKAKGWL